MIKTTRWSPDTCECILEFQWETEERSSRRIHTFRNPISVCGFHATVSRSEVSAVAYEENLRKNWTLDIVHNRVPSLEPENVPWEYTDSRVLSLNLTGLASLNDRSFIQDAADTQFGPGKVTVS